MTKRLVTTIQILLIALVSLTGCLGPSPDEESLSTTESEISTPPTNVTVTVTAATRVTVNWTQVPMATKYYIYRSPTLNGTYTYLTSSRFPPLAVANLTAGAQVCFKVAADGPGGPSPLSAGACATPSAGTVPGAPMNVTATPTASTRITVAWGSVATATKYFVYQQTGAGAFTFAASTVAPNTSVSIANLLPNTIYCYRVQAENAAGLGVFSATVCAQTFIAGLELYTKLNEGSGTTITDSSGQMRNGSAVGGITWTGTDRPPLDNSPFALSASGASGAAASIPHASPLWLSGDFTVAFWAKLVTAPAGEVRFLGKRVPGCGAVNWEIAQNTTNGLHIKGNSTPVSFGQNLAVGAWTHIAVTQTGTTARFYLNGTNIGMGTYITGVRSNDPLQIGNSGGCGSSPFLIDEVQVFSTPLSAAQVASIGQVPPAPANFTAAVVGSSRVNLAWNAVPTASKYFIYKGTAPGNQTFFTSVLAPTLTFSDGTNAPMSTSSWTVRSVRDGLISNFTPEQVVTTQPGPGVVQGVTATATSSTRVTVAWTASTGAQKYFVYRSTAGGAYAFQNTVLAPGTQLAVANLTPNTMYSFIVRVQTANGTSGDSDAATVTTPN